MNVILSEISMGLLEMSDLIYQLDYSLNVEFGYLFQRFFLPSVVQHVLNASIYGTISSL